MKAKELPPNERNPRKITDDQLEALRKAMIEFGDLSGLVFNEMTKKTVGGHQRIKILADAPITITRKYKEPTRNGTVAEGYVTYEGERFIYRAVKWSPTKEKAAMIAANKHGGYWDNKELNSLLEELDTGEFDMDLTGFLEEELEDIFTAAAPEVIYEQSIQLKPAKEYVVILCEKPEEFDQLKALLKLKQVRRGGYKKGSPFDSVGTERVIPFARLKSLC